MIRQRLKGRPRSRLKAAAAVVGAAVVIAAALLAFAFAEARRDPVVRRAAVASLVWPPGARPVTVALFSDLHLGNQATDPQRLLKIVEQINRLHPDLVLIAGDFLAGHRSVALGRDLVLLAPLAELQAPLGVVGVLGNHDYWAGADAVRSALTRLGVLVLTNASVQRGPIALGGIDDAYTHHDAIGSVAAQLRTMPGGRIILTHSPEIVSSLPSDFPLLLAGHTHCGQIRLPWLGSIDMTLRYGRYECGLVRDPGRTTVVTAGVGTSVAPLRLGAPPDVWLLTVGPASSKLSRLEPIKRPAPHE